MPRLLAIVTDSPDAPFVVVVADTNRPHPGLPPVGTPLGGAPTHAEAATLAAEIEAEAGYGSLPVEDDEDGDYHAPPLDERPILSTDHTPWAVVAVWDDPEVGAAVWGPYDGQAAAEAAIPACTAEATEDPALLISIEAQPLSRHQGG